MLYSRAGDVSAEAADAVCRGLLAEHRAGRVPGMPRARPRLRGDRSVDGARSLAHASARKRSPRGRPHGTGRTCATSWSRSATTSTCRGATLPKKDRDWILFTDEQPVGAGVSRLHAEGNARRGAPEGRARVHGHLHGRAQVRAAHVRDHAERADEEARRALHGRQRVPGVRRQAPEARSPVGDVRRPRHRRSSPRCSLDRMAEVLRPRRTASASRTVGGEAHRGAAAGGGSGRSHRHAAGARPRLPRDGSRDADAVARRTATPAPGDADPLAPVRRRVRARRTLGGPASGGQRSAASRRSTSCAPPATRSSSSNTTST